MQRDKPIEPGIGMEPECRAKMCKVERSRSSDRGKSIRLAKIECEIAEDEEARILVQPIDAGLVLLLLQKTFPCQAHQIAPRFEYEQYAGQQFGSTRFLRHPFRALLTEQHAQIGGTIEVEPARSSRFCRIRSQRLLLSSSRMDR